MDADGGTVMEPECAGFRDCGQYSSHSKRINEWKEAAN
jgi:hypothetical protein